MASGGFSHPRDHEVAGFRSRTVHATARAARSGDPQTWPTLRSPRVPTHRGLFGAHPATHRHPGGPISTEPRINDRIRVPEVRLVGPDGEQVGIVRIEDALRLAEESNLDLVEVAPNSRPPVVRLMDYGKFKYESAMKAREARRNQTHVQIKEQKLRPKIDDHDYETKKRNVERFLNGGDKVKVTIMFRGREQSRPELGYRLLQRMATDVAESGTVEFAPKQDGRNMVMVLAPTKKKADAQAERKEEVARQAAERQAEHDRDKAERAAGRSTGTA